MIKVVSVELNWLLLHGKYHFGETADCDCLTSTFGPLLSRRLRQTYNKF